MWHAARAQEKKLRSMMFDHRKRAERRRAFYEAMVRCGRVRVGRGARQLTVRACRQYGDPLQMIRVVGTAAKLHADAAQHFYHENTEHLSVRRLYSAGVVAG
jgi:splicing factor, arginine/serine-rich 16